MTDPRVVEVVAAAKPATIADLGLEPKAGITMEHHVNPKAGLPRIALGASVRLWSEEALSEDLGLQPDAVVGLLDTLGLPRLVLPGTEHRYVNLYVLESSLFSLSLPKSLYRTASGDIDLGLVKLHQELAGVMYAGATKELIRNRVKLLAKALKREAASDIIQPRATKKKGRNIVVHE